MVDNTTDNYDFPLMTLDSDDYVGEWADVLDTGGGYSSTDGLIEPLDSILNAIEEGQWETTSSWDGDDMTVENENGTAIEFIAED